MTALRWGTPEPAFPPREDNDVTPVTFKVHAIEDGDEPLTWRFVTVDDKALAWLELNMYGQWMFSPADEYGNPDVDQTRMLDLGDEEIRAGFVASYEAACKVMDSEATREALLAAHRTQIDGYRADTFDLAFGIAKRRAERLEW